MSTLYELTSDYTALLEMAEDADEQALKDTLEGIEGAIEDKADGYAKVLRELDKDSAGLDAEIKRLQAKKTAIANATVRIRTNLQDAMIATGKTKFKTSLFSFGIQKNPPFVVIDDDQEVPIDYLIVADPKPDKKTDACRAKSRERVALCTVKANGEPAHTVKGDRMNQFRNLRADEIDVRVATCSEKGKRPTASREHASIWESDGNYTLHLLSGLRRTSFN